MCTHVRQNFWKISSNFEHHSKPTMNINSQHHNLLGSQILTKSEDFCIWRPFCTLVTMATATILNLFNPPIAATYYGGYSYKVDHNMAPKPWISIPNIKIYLETKFRPNRRIFVFWRSFQNQNGRHSKPTMDINSQHHNLLGSQISPKSEDFCIWWPFCTLVTMATAAILNPKSCHTLRWIFLQSFMKFDERNPKEIKSPFFVSMTTATKLVQAIPIFLAYLVPRDVDVVPITFHQFLFGE